MMTMGYKIHQFLKRNNVPFETVDHPRSYPALETAVVEHALPEAFAKVVMVKVNGKDCMFVIPANRRIDLLLGSERSILRGKKLRKRGEKYEKCNGVQH